MSNPSYEVIRRDAVEQLIGIASESAHFEARILMQMASGYSPAKQIIHAREPVPNQVLANFEGLLTRRLKGEPIAYILGEKEFWSLTFKIGRQVLIPRPETEGVVSQALTHMDGVKAPRVLDVGTGSGAILVSILHERSDAMGVGVDISKATLGVAKQNAERHKVSQRSLFQISNYLQDVEGRFDIVVANPPYISEDAMLALPKTVDKFEPHLALNGGPDGLDAYRTIIAGVAGKLKPVGYLVIEVGFDQKTAVFDLLDKAGATNIFCQKDLAGHDRVISAKFC